MTIDGGAGGARGLTKQQKRVLRELSGEAYSAELAAELAKLSSEFDRWKAGEIEPSDLAGAIHRFHEGPSRRLCSGCTTPETCSTPSLAPSHSG